jgi:CheY-like chemotaxis protein
MGMTVAPSIAGKLRCTMIGGETISQSPLVLVIEDEPLLRIDAVQVLREAGYNTLEAGNADEAIALLEARKDIRIVFTDIQMPGSMDGLKLSWAIRDRWPPVEMIITSGQRIPAADDMPERVRFLPKPYDGAKLVQAVADFV